MPASLTVLTWFVSQTAVSTTGLTLLTTGLSGGAHAS